MRMIGRGLKNRDSQVPPSRDSDFIGLGSDSHEHFSKSQQVIHIAAKLRRTPADRAVLETAQLWKSNLRMVLFGPPGPLVLPAFHLCPLSHLPLVVLDLNLGSGVAAETASAEDGRQQ